MCLLPPSFVRYPNKHKNAHDGSGFIRWVMWLWAIWHDTPKQDYDMAPEISCKLLRSTSTQCHLLFLFFPFHYNLPRTKHIRHDACHVVNKYVKIYCCMCWAENKMQAANEFVRPLFLQCSESKMLCFSWFDRSTTLGAREKLQHLAPL